MDSHKACFFMVCQALGTYVAILLLPKALAEAPTVFIPLCTLLQGGLSNVLDIQSVSWSDVNHTWIKSGFHLCRLAASMVLNQAAVIGPLDVTLDSLCEPS